MNKISIEEAVSQKDEEDSWKCRSCDTLIEHESTKPYCRTCKMYWDIFETEKEDE